ncbi:restriction endonuclease subunit S [Rhizobium laguerreae]|uniref:Restriction endonuclease subunit S n=1 Tax=Rhizobium laguerreae TaxID=1076926 RepID=A0A6N9ZB37_9HYPH|nr:restriction endonuclease subunit S [Rhizobium laguerreae]NEH90744.1 restriction endonuclease subunit S [Rhizobium laguerreae]
MSGLPRGWVTSSLGNFGEVYCGQSSTAADVNSDGRGTAYVTGPEQWTGTAIELNKWTTTPKRIVPDGCIFITVKGAGVGKMFPGISCAIGRDVYAYRPSQELSYPFVAKALAHTVNAVIREARGDIPGLSKEHITDHVVPLPPLAEQKRIVAKLDALNAKSACARMELARIEILVSRFKQAVLSKAFSGELTKDWRNGQPVASEWRASSVGSECEIQLGKMLDKAKNKGEPTRYLRNINVRWGTFDLSDLLFMNMTAEDRSKLDIRDGDLLLCEGGEPGRCAVWRHGPTDISFQKALMRIRPNSHLLPDCLYYFVRWASENDILSRHFTGTTIKHLPQIALSRVALVVAPIPEQHEIVRRIKSAFAKIDRLAAEASRALELVGRLDEAILAKAFRGELVPQDDNDEPASLLLERIHKAKRGLERPQMIGCSPWSQRSGSWLGER